MKKIGYYILAVLLLAVSFPLRGEDHPQAGLSRDTILIGDQIEWLTRLKLPADCSLEFDTMSNPVVEGVELIRQLSVDTVKQKKKFTDVEVKATITSFDSGSYVIPGRTFYFYKDGSPVDSLVVEPYPLEVTTIPVDTTTYQMFDIKGQYRYPVTFKEVVPWIILVLAVCGLAYLVYRMIQNRRQNKTLFGKPIVKDPPHIIALRSLEKIRNEQLWQNNKVKQYYTSVTDTLRQYIEGRFEVTAMERTSKEMLDELEKIDLPKNEFEELKELFYLADLVKFAKYTSSTDENEKAIPTAVRFVNATFLQELEEEKDGK